MPYGPETEQAMRSFYESLSEKDRRRYAAMAAAREARSMPRPTSSSPSAAAVTDFMSRGWWSLELGLGAERDGGPGHGLEVRP